MSNRKPFAINSMHSSASGSSANTIANKSHVLAGVQDAYWSDDDNEDNECPLCLEEMDLSDINFKPCTCGYQICRFCWHHIKENLNGRCPACRRPYTDEGVQFKPISSEDQKRLTLQKKQRERERKDLEQLGRSREANMRIVQRNLVYVTGMGSKFASSDVLTALRSPEYFGKYGKINHLFLHKRVDPTTGTPVLGIYVTYARREDAARAIAAVDGTASPSGGNEVVRASYGTTKYCMSFLRNLPCSNPGCRDLHEWGDDKDSFTKEDLSTLKHMMKDTESRSRIVQSRSKTDEPDAPALPRSASWGQKGGTPVMTPASTTPLATSTSTNGRTARIPSSRGPKPNGTASKSLLESTPTSGPKTRADRKPPSSASSLPSSSRPSTPSSLPPKPSVEVTSTPLALQTTSSSKPDRTTSPTRHRKQKSAEKPVTTVRTAKDSPPRSTTATPTDVEASPVPTTARVQDLKQESLPPPSPASTAPDSLPSISTPPPQLPGPPGLGPPPASLPSSNQYQLSSQARALMDDMLNRRTSNPSDTVIVSPFPDFDRTLSSLVDGSFTFNLTSDPKVARSLQEEGIQIMTSSPTKSNLFDPFSSALSSAAPSPINPHFGHTFPPRPSSSFANSPISSVGEVDARMPRGLSYAGSFDPFAEGSHRDGSPAPSSASALDEDPVRRGSKFGFARRDSANVSAFGGSASNSPLRYNDNLPLPVATMFAGPSETAGSRSPLQSQPAGSWGFGNVPMAPPGLMLPTERPHVQYQSPQQHFASAAGPNLPQSLSFNQGQVAPHGLNDLTMDLRGLLLGDRTAESNLMHIHQQQMLANFDDPAIASMSMGPQFREAAFISGPPPGMTAPPMAFANQAPPPGLSNMDSLPNLGRRQSNNVPLVSPSAATNDTPASSSVDDTIKPNSPSISSPSVLSHSDFPSLPTSKPIAPKERPPLTLPNLQPNKLNAPSPNDSKPPLTIPIPQSAPLPVPRAMIPLPPKPSAETLEAASKQEARKPPTAAATSPRSPQSMRVIIPASVPPPAPASAVPPSPPTPPTLSKSAARKAKQKAASPIVPNASLPVVEQEAIVSRKTKKNKPIARPKPKKDNNKTAEPSIADESVAADSSQAGTRQASPVRETESESNSLDETIARFSALSQIVQDYYLENVAFFNEDCVDVSDPDMGYESLVRALSALSNGAPVNSLPVEAIDAAVSSFQQLLEMLSQTISDLLRLLPRLKWTDTASLDSMLKDMIRSGEFMEEDGLDASVAAAEAAYEPRSDDVNALTDALTKRARWMETQLFKLESLHHDVNSAAVRVVMYFSDRGWDQQGQLPRSGDALARFDAIGNVQVGDNSRKMTVQELELALAEAQRDEEVIEGQLRRSILSNKQLLAFSGH
ncbi:hypothetical protein DL93DRAFT_312456 [Clavulina sp. PMI_390]|nr:hypothetical protein DL93DRAFT_312456 [Clavulina sp. PMI_390]